MSGFGQSGTKFDLFSEIVHFFEEFGCSDLVRMVSCELVRGLAFGASVQVVIVNALPIHTRDSVGEIMH